MGISASSPAEAAHLLSLLTEVASWATLAGTSFILMSYLVFKEIHFFHLRLVFFLAVVDFFTAITFLTNVYLKHDDEVTCSILGSSLQFFELSSTLWSFCIAYVLDQVIRVNNFHVEIKERYFHLCCWIVPAFTVIICLAQDLFVNTGLWCWITGVHHELFRWMFFYGPTIIVLIYVVAVYVLVSRKIHQQNSMSDGLSVDTTIQKTFRLYIIGWCLCWAPAIIDRVQGLFQPTNPIFFLQCLHAFLTPLGGFCNSIAIGFNDEIQTQYIAIFRKWGLSCRRANKQKNIQSSKDERVLREMLKEYDYAALRD